jgi:hypothetical protein
MPFGRDLLRRGLPPEVPPSLRLIPREARWRWDSCEGTIELRPGSFEDAGISRPRRATRLHPWTGLEKKPAPVGGLQTGAV